VTEGEQEKDKRRLVADPRRNCMCLMMDELRIGAVQPEAGDEASIMTVVDQMVAFSRQDTAFCTESLSQLSAMAAGMQKMASEIERRACFQRLFRTYSQRNKRLPGVRPRSAAVPH
jgi:hypothetical protein